MELDQLVKELKQTYPDIFIVTINGQTFIFRFLTRHEWREINLYYKNDRFRFEEEICKMTVVWPSINNWDEIDAGIIPNLAMSIVEESGYGPNKLNRNMLIQYRLEMTTFEAQAEAIIKAAFPDQSFEEMIHWTPDKLMRYLAKAEWVLKTVYDKDLGFDLEEYDDKDDDEDKEEIPMKSRKEICIEMHQVGIDPMIELQGLVKVKNPYMELPFIAGTNAWKNEVILDGLSK